MYHSVLKNSKRLRSLWGFASATIFNCIGKTLPSSSFIVQLSVQKGQGSSAQYELHILDYIGCFDGCWRKTKRLCAVIIAIQTYVEESIFISAMYAYSITLNTHDSCWYMVIPVLLYISWYDLLNKNTNLLLVLQLLLVLILLFQFQLLILKEKNIKMSKWVLLYWQTVHYTALIDIKIFNTVFITPILIVL